jgi:hypothetical protein
MKNNNQQVWLAGNITEAVTVEISKLKDTEAGKLLMLSKITPADIAQAMDKAAKELMKAAEKNTPKPK